MPSVSRQWKTVPVLDIKERKIRTIASGAATAAARMQTSCLSQPNTKCNQSFGVQMCVTAGSSGVLWAERHLNCTDKSSNIPIYPLPKMGTLNWPLAMFLLRYPALPCSRFFLAFGISEISLLHEGMLVRGGHRSRNVQWIFSTCLLCHAHILSSNEIHGNHSNCDTVSEWHYIR